MKFKLIFCSLIPLLLLAQVLFGQQGSFGLKGGGSRYFGDFTDSRIEPFSGVALDLMFAERFSGQILGYFSRLSAEDSTAYFETNVYGLAGFLKILPLKKQIVTPFLLGGLEYYRINPADKGNDPLPNNANGVYSLNRLGIPVGGGLSVFPTEKISIDLEALYHFSFTDYLDDLEAGESTDRYLTAAIGISFHFGGLKDTDNDGIPDKQDADPLRPEDFDGFEDFDGKPDPDNDEDGVPDVRDLAPMEPEDIDGFEDEDGVPDPDNDQDGIPDAVDLAPNEKEDFDNFQDADGAPDPDNDGDGIPDEIDLCPGTDETFSRGIDTRETINGYEDADGCPDKKPEIAVEKGESIILEGVYFATGSAELTQNSRTILDKVVRTLKENPKIVVEIRGYTDNTGSYQTNMRLSRARADAVKIYLINNGIDASRVRTRGFGPENPIAPNTTRQGRAKNRRIEFYRIN
ncbi:MAG: OmpA family protein [Calditrichaeota bacterium]|nr:OmpA family protein [Calditrichota bacterium]RQV99722.1 MAG: OmpA family protein [Calditrichota bacterium]